jgi:hypothetical protein
MPVDNSMTDKERASVFHTVQEDRKYWLQAAISRIMKRIRPGFALFLLIWDTSCLFFPDSVNFILY